MSDRTSLEYGRPPARRTTRVPRWIAYLTIGFGVLALFVFEGPFDLTSRVPLAMRNVCTGDLHQIGLCIRQYCQDHGGAYPDSLATVLSSGDAAAEWLVCPASHDTPASLATTHPTTRELAAAFALPGHLSYTYRGRGWIDGAIPSDAVVAYEPVSNHGNGANFLFADARAAFVPAARAARLIAAAAATTRPVSAATIP